MMPDQLQPGARIRIEQSIRRRQGAWTTPVEGEIVELCSMPTGSWHTKGQDGQLWLGRIKLKKSDGELSIITLDEGSHITFLAPEGNQPA